jgi:hypothetical protein
MLSFIPVKVSRYGSRLVLPSDESVVVMLLPDDNAVKVLAALFFHPMKV